MKNQRTVFFISLSVFILTALISWGMISSRSQSQNGTSKNPPITLEIEVLEIHKKQHAIPVRLYGTVQPKYRLKLHSPFPGTVKVAADLSIGQYIPAGTLLYKMDLRELHAEKKKLSLEIDSLVSHQQSLERDVMTLKNREKILKHLLFVSQKLLEKHQKRLLIEQKLFEKIETLHQQHTASQTEFLNAENKLLTANFSHLNAEQNLFVQSDQFQQLLLQIESREQEVVTMQFNIQQQKKQKEKIEIQIGKGEIKADFPSFIEEIFIPYQQEVAAGTPLTTVRESSEVELLVHLPDHYFSWIYHEKSIKTLLQKPVSIHLVNHRFNKTFNGGRIASIGRSVSSSTRSLPISIRRTNPIDPRTNLPILDEELKPGMYCEVQLELGEVENTFLIPSNYLEEHRQIFYLENSGNGLNIVALKDFKIIEELPQGLLIQTDQVGNTLLLVQDTIKQIPENAKILPKKVNPSYADS